MTNPGTNAALYTSVSILQKCDYDASPESVVLRAANVSILQKCDYDFNFQHDVEATASLFQFYKSAIMTGRLRF